MGRPGVFGTHAEAYLAAGLVPIPVDSVRKAPMVRGYADASARAVRGWLEKPALAGADGIGFVLGVRSGIAEVDVDTHADDVLADVVKLFGETPVIAKTARGYRKLWYRATSVQARMIRPIEGLPVDVLARGLTIAPPSWRSDLGAAYAFEAGGLTDLSRLPPMREHALALQRGGSSSLPERGGRNDALLKMLLGAAPHCDDLEAMLDVAHTRNQEFARPLPDWEAAKCARSAWGYQVEGRNLLGRRRNSHETEDALLNTLIDCPDAYTLLPWLRRMHAGRQEFSIAPRAMSETQALPWPRRKIERARDVLVERGFLEIVRAPSKTNASAGVYRIRNPLPGTGHNDKTPPPHHAGTGEQAADRPLADIRRQQHPAGATLPNDELCSGFPNDFASTEREPKGAA